MFINHLGEIIALATALCWTITSVSFEAAGKKIGTLSLNFIRLLIAFVLISLYCYFTRGLLLPIDASAHNWKWLGLSGIIGFVIGDLFLFQAFIELGARVSMLVMASVPPVTSLLGYIFLDEKLTYLNLIGMFITILGIGIVVFQKSSKKIKLVHPVRGLFFAFIGALGQSLGMILSKIGMKDLNAFAASQIRIIFAIIGFSILFFFMKKWAIVFKGLSNISAMKYLTVGAIFGPFVGVSLSLLALNYTSTGNVSTITSIVPVLIIPFSVIIFKEKISLKEILGSIITILGVATLFL
jgi:drug/metabolite transporter (DMT)-like permease